MNPETFAEFEARALAQGFDEVLVREWAPGQVVGTHTHPFDVSSLVVRGDVVLTAQAPDDAPVFAGAHARRALGVIRQNVALAMLTKLAFLVSAVFGAAPLWLAVVADTGATVAVTLNGLRLLRAR